MEARDDGLTVEASPQIALVPPEHVRAAWARCREWVEAALAFSQQHELSSDEVYQRLLAGEFLLVLVTLPDVLAAEAGLDEVVGCTVLNRAVSPQTGRAYIAVVSTAGRHVEAWIQPLFRAVADMARQAGCDRLLAVGRPGWGRLLKPLGTRRVGEILVYELEA